MSSARAIGRAGLLVAALGACRAGGTRALDLPPPERVVVLVVPGLAGDEVARRMKRGELPHLAALARAGGFAPLAPLLPGDEPAVWAALNSGLDPSGNGVPGATARAFSGGFPMPAAGDLAPSTVVVSAPDGPAAEAFAVELPVLASRLRAPAFWDRAGAAGVPAVVLGSALTVGRSSPPGVRVLHGEGVLDASLGTGAWTLFTDEPRETRPRTTASGGRIRPLQPVEGRLEGMLDGLVDLPLARRLQRELDRVALERQEPELRPERGATLDAKERGLRLRLEALERAPTAVPLVLEPAGARLRVGLGDEVQELAEGEWSEPYPLAFRLTGGLVVRASTRVKLLHLEAPLRLYVDSVDLDPAQVRPWYPLSAPPELAARLVREIGPFPTAGWGPTATRAYTDGAVDVATVAEDLEHDQQARERWTGARLGRDDWRLFVSVFPLADRAAHVLTALADPRHPRHDPDEAARRVLFAGRVLPAAEVVRACAEELDRVVGEVRAALRPDDVLVVVSPFALQPVRRVVELNAWLAQEGFLVLYPGAAEPLDLTAVDWSRTRAYALGAGQVYLNLRGREPRGIVAPEEAPALLAELRTRLGTLVDPETGRRLCQEVLVPAEVHRGPFRSEEADLLVGFAPGARAARATAMGEIAWSGGALGPVVQDASARDSGDHASLAPEAVRGFLAASRPFRAAGALDVRVLAPSVLALLGLADDPAAAGFDCAPLDFGIRRAAPEGQAPVESTP